MYIAPSDLIMKRWKIYPRISSLWKIYVFLSLGQHFQEVFKMAILCEAKYSCGCLTFLPSWFLVCFGYPHEVLK